MVALLPGFQCFALDAQEGEMLASAMAEVGAHYDVKISGKNFAIANLLIVAALIYVPRIFMMKAMARPRVAEPKPVNPSPKKPDTPSGVVLNFGEGMSGPVAKPSWAT